MVDSAIQWTQNTWNPWHGCHKVSAGCKFCYMFREKKMYGQDPNIVLRSKTKFKDPLRWPKEPTLCFTCSWSDWLIEEADAWRDEAYGIIRATPWITYQILTKRIERAGGRIPDPPLPNIWWGVSVEDQKTADERTRYLRNVPAAVRFISQEPQLEFIDWKPGMLEGISWLIIGGESGPGARPFDIDWARNTIDQCKAAGVACFFKQAGSSPVLDGTCIRLHDRKGGDLRELPPDLNIREFPVFSSSQFHVREFPVPLERSKAMTGAELIAQERARQMSVEGWTPEHDDTHENFQITRAAMAYAMRTISGPVGSGGPPAWWPWDASYFKGGTPIRNLTKAGALIAAEIDRLQRERQRNTAGTPPLDRKS